MQFIRSPRECCKTIATAQMHLIASKLRCWLLAFLVYSLRKISFCQTLNYSLLAKSKPISNHISFLNAKNNNLPVVKRGCIVPFNVSLQV